MSNDTDIDQLYTNICDSTNADYFPLKNEDGKQYSLCYNMNENADDTKYTNKQLTELKNKLSSNISTKCKEIIESNNEDKIKQLVNTLKCINPYEQDKLSTNLTPKQRQRLKNKPIICRRACSDTHFNYSSNDKNELQTYCLSKINKNEIPIYHHTAGICNIIPQKPTN